MSSQSQPVTLVSIGKRQSASLPMLECRQQSPNLLLLQVRLQLQQSLCDP